MLFQVGYLTTMKYSVKYAGVHTIDHMLLWHILGTLVDLTVALSLGYKLAVDKEARCPLLTRSFIGVLAHMAMIYGVALVPLVCH